MTTNKSISSYKVNSNNVLSQLEKYILADGYDFVLDLNNSYGSKLVEKRTSKEYLDFFTCFASIPLGMNHPKMQNEEFIKYIGNSALNKPSNSDVYTEEIATFVKTFFEIAVPKSFVKAFFISGGALAVENALKTAFDWKVRKNFEKGYSHERGYKILHFKEAFHGRSGYTMSLTNTDHNKIKYFPKFDWPRVDNPMIHFPLTEESLNNLEIAESNSIKQIKQAFVDNPDEIAAIIIEPIQGEGGDNHFRPEYLKQLRTICDENDSLLIFDEVQTGVGLTGTMWAHEQLEVVPDIMAFGKKMQTCGIVVTKRVTELKDNVFYTSGRINSTWGGNLVDMVRATKYLEIIEEEKLVDNSAKMGKKLLTGLQKMQEEHPNLISNARGRGLMCAFDLPNPEIRDKFVSESYENQLMILGCGKNSIRFRPPINITNEDLELGFEIINKVIKKIK